MLTEDGYFISRCLDGETEAFGFLVDKYKASVYAFLYSRLRNFHDAEDVTQKVFVRAYEKLGTLSSWESFARWLYTIAYSQCRNFIRECQNRPDREFVEDQNPAVLRNLSMDSYRDAQVSNSLKEEVEEAMASLPEMYSQILILHYFGGMRVKEIATVLSITPTNVKKRLSRARAMLKEEMPAMMDTAFEGQRLQASFTFRIVESIKRIKIHPEPRITQVPWGLSIASGIIMAVLVVSSHLSLPHSFDAPADSDPISNMQMTEASEFPVDVLETFQVTGYRGYDDSGELRLSFQQNAAPMAGNFPEKPSVQLGKGILTGMAYSPDGRLLAASGGPGIRLYDTNNLDETAILQGPAYQVVFSPDGKFLASTGRKYEICLWDVQEQKQIGLLQGHTDWLQSIAFSPDGKILASGGYDKTVRLWDIREQKQIGLLQGHTEWVSSVAFSTDGKILASGSGDKTVRFWDVQGQKQMGLLTGHTEWVTSVAFSPDGKVLASGSGDKTVRLWDIQGQEQIKLLPGHTEWVTSVAFSPDGKVLASGSGDKTVRLWDVQAQKQIGLLQGHMKVRSIAFSPEGRTIASRFDNEINFWDVQEQTQTGLIEGFTQGIHSLAFSPDGKSLASENFGPVYLWDIQAQKQVGVLEGESAWPGCTSLAFTPDGKTIASIYWREIYLFDVKEQRRLGVLKGHTDDVHSLAISPDGKILVSTGNSDCTVRLWDIANQKEIGVLLNGSWPHCADISPDGETIAASIGGERLIRLWDTRTQEEIGVLRDSACAAWSVAFSPDGKTLASCNQCGEIRLWDVKKQKQIGELKGLTSAAYITFSPDGKWLASVDWGDGIGTARIWDIQEQKQIATLVGYAGGVGAVAFSPDGKWLAGGSQGAILLWEVNIPVQGKSVEPTGKQLGKWGEIKETELFQNFPNPFNPETWIPYQLGNDTHVKFSIYDSTGKLVRQMKLGHKPAGSYMDKEKAIYWDGRNETGEPVSSGTYFVHLSADSFSSTRKMVMIR